MDYFKIARDIKEKIDIVDIVSFYVKDLKKRGKNYIALCPFHSEKTPSFTVSREKQIFYCFGCNNGGDVISFVSKIENISKIQALKKLASMAGIFIDNIKLEEENPYEKERKLIKQINMEAALIYNSMLKSSEAKKAIEFLKEKGIKEQSILNFMLGYAPSYENFLYNSLSKKYPKDILIKTSLFSTSFGKLTDVFRDRIIIPIRNISGDIVGFGARTVGNENPKYLNTQENQIFIKRRNLFGLFNSLTQIRKERKAIIVEGYFDVILMHQYLFTITLSTMGTAFSQEHAHILKNYVDEIILMFDSDKAGINAAIKAADISIEEGLYPKVIVLEEGIDPDELLITKGPDAMLNLINNALDIISFKINLIKKKNTELSPDKKNKAVEFICDTIAKERNEVIRMEWIKNVSKEFSVDESIIKKIVLQKTKSKNISIQKNQITLIKPEISIIEENLIEMLFKNPSLAEILKNGFEISYLESEFSKKIVSFFIGLKDTLNLEEKLISQYPDYENEILRLILKSQNINDETVTPENFKKTLLIIEKNYLEKEIKKIKEKNISSLEELKKYNELILKLKNINLSI
ncbi:MAG: DNA primase [Elusimicrobiales bacterium]|nr:DNA primase [Elusimicrobiales bacterium]